jgi:hypothetical protein
VLQKTSQSEFKGLEEKRDRNRLCSEFRTDVMESRDWVKFERTILVEDYASKILKIRRKKKGLEHIAISKSNKSRDQLGAVLYWDLRELDTKFTTIFHRTMAINIKRIRIGEIFQ